MILWYALEDLLGAILFDLAHVFGGLARIQQANARVLAELRPGPGGHPNSPT